jgi:hypothetical protein
MWENSGMWSPKAFVPWFNRYVWQFKTGKAGTFSVLLALSLDMYSRAETLFRGMRAMIAPTAIAIAQSGWSHLILVIGGLALIYKSTVKGKDTPIPRTPEERLDDIEGQMVTTDTLTQLGKIHDNVAGRIATLEKDRTEAITERSSLNISIGEVRRWLDGLQQKMREVPHVVTFLSGFGNLIREGGACSK